MDRLGSAAADWRIREPAVPGADVAGLSTEELVSGDTVNCQALVSVVVIFRDAERFLDEAVSSVFAQTYSPWELLLVDDSSVDGSTVSAQRWADENSERVFYLAHPDHVNRGMSASRNLGIRHARGKYLAFLDADDVWLPGKLAQQVALLQAWPEAAMLYGRTRWWYSWTGRAEDQGRDFVHPLGVAPDTLLKPPMLLIHLLQDEGASPCTCSILVRREIVEQVGGFEEAFRGLYEDQAFCAKVSLTFPVVASSQCWYWYRQHPDSACAVAGRMGQTHMARLRFLTWLGGYLSEREISDPEVWRAYRQQLWLGQHPLLDRGLGRTRQLAGRIRAFWLRGDGPSH
jgi:glycosyltransferase involved in cell wall biosynthesis